MTIFINHNLMATNTARNLNAHYSNLKTSTQRLSTGLRINSASDDTAGLAIRELMRTDISALNQGIRNANDAISLIQTADSALSIIDEKLIRMKELAEQAATGTYDSTQRMMIESEYQQMASEITRIANATDFNGIKLLDGTLSAEEHNGSGLNAKGKMKIHFGSCNDSAEDYYYIQVDESTAQAFGVGDASTWEDASNRITNVFSSSLKKMLNEIEATGQHNGTGIDADEFESIKKKSLYWANEFNTNLAELSIFSNASELANLYEKFKNDDEVKALSDLFERSIEDYSTVTYRKQNKMEYALGHVAMKDASLFTFTNYIPATDVYEASVAAQNAIVNVIKAPDGLAAKANATITDAVNSANAVNSAVAVADDIVVAMTEAAVAVKDATSVIHSMLVADPTALSISYTDYTGNEYAIEYTSTGHITQIVTNTYTFFCNNVATSSDFTVENITMASDGSNNFIMNTANGIPTMLDSNNNTFTLDVSGTYGKCVSVKDSSANIYDIKTTFSGGIPTTYLTSMNDSTGSSLVFSGYVATSTDIDATSDVMSFTDVDGNTFTFNMGTNNTVSLTDSSGNFFAINGTLATLAGGDTTATTLITSLTDRSGNVFLLTGGALISVQMGSKTYTLEMFLEDRATRTATGAIASGTVRSVDNYEFSFVTDDDGVSGILVKATDPSGADIMRQALATGGGILSDIFETAADKAATLDYAGFTVATQEDAQKSLVAINNAVVEKDKIRTHLGALQNRLENTISNLNVQTENLQAAESRISDVDVATEMTNFVRNQILTQSAVAMLSQANTLPQMALKIIGVI